MLVNHLAKRHPDISPDSVPELNLPILRTTRDYYCQYCDKVYKSSSKRKAHILKNHPGAALPMSNRRQGSYPEVAGLPNPSFSQTVGSVTTHPQSCQWCHKQYASKAKLLQHQRKKHSELIPKRDTKIDKNVEENVITKRKDVVVNEQGYKRDFEVSIKISSLYITSCCSIYVYVCILDCEVMFQMFNVSNLVFIKFETLFGVIFMQMNSKCKIICTIYVFLQLKLCKNNVNDSYFLNLK